jgi:hypothetical protein
MLKMIKSQNPDKEYPPNMGQKWTDEEECSLFEELHTNIDIETIAQRHSRTVGGIKSRQKHIAYRMYLSNSSMENIVNQTKLNIESIEETIKIRENKEKTPKKEKTIPKNENDEEHSKITKPMSIEHELFKMKKDIKEIKKTVNDIFEMMRSFYEMKDASQEL